MSQFIYERGAVKKPVYLSTRTVKELVHWSVRDCDRTGLFVNGDCEGAGSLVSEGLRWNRSIFQWGLWRSWFTGQCGTATEPVYLSMRSVKDLVHWSMTDCDGTSLLVKQDCEGAGSLVSERLRWNLHICQRGLWRSWFIGQWGTATEPVYLSTRTVKKLVHWSMTDCDGTGISVNEECEGAGSLVSEGLQWNRYICQRGLWRSWFIGQWRTATEPVYWSNRTVKELVHWSVRDCDGTGISVNEDCEGAGSLVSEGLRQNRSICQWGLWRNWFIGQWGTAMEPVYLSTRTVKELVHWSVRDCNGTGISVNEDCEGAGSLVNGGLRRNQSIGERGLWRSWFIGQWATETEPVYLSTRTVKELVHWSVRDCDRTGISVNEDCEGAGSLVSEGLRRIRYICLRGLCRSWFIGQWGTATEPVYLLTKMWMSWFTGQWGTTGEPVYCPWEIVKEPVYLWMKDYGGTGLLVSEGLLREPVYWSGRTVVESVDFLVRDCEGSGLFDYEELWLTRAHRVIVLRSAVLVLLFLCAFMFHLPIFFRVASIVWLHQCQWSNHEEYGWINNINYSELIIQPW